MISHFFYFEHPVYVMYGLNMNKKIGQCLCLFVCLEQTWPLYGPQAKCPLTVCLEIIGKLEVKVGRLTAAAADRCG